MYTQPATDVEMLDLPEVPMPEPDVSQPIALQHPKRQHFLPAAFRDLVPSQPKTCPPMPPIHIIPNAPPQNPVQQHREKSPSPSMTPNEPTPLETITTEPNEFGLYRIFTQYPTHDPVELTSLDDVCDASTFAMSKLPSRDPGCVFGQPKVTDAMTVDSPYAPFPNASTYYMMQFAYSDNTGGLSGIQQLNNEVIQQPDFDPRELHGFNAVREAKHLDDYNSMAPTTELQTLPFDTYDGWINSSVKIKLPCAGVTVKEKKAAELQVGGVVHRDLLSVMKQAYMDDSATEFNLRGFKQMWNCGDGSEPICVHGEVYTSDAFLKMEQEVLLSPPEPGCELEWVIALIMAYSDSTHLASFGTASLWPGYLWFGSQSKYSRAKPSKFSAHHLVYFPLVSSSMGIVSALI